MSVRLPRGMLSSRGSAEQLEPVIQHLCWQASTFWFVPVIYPTWRDEVMIKTRHGNASTGEVQVCVGETCV